ncbi:uncharacterized protein LOC127832695 [Dreissena polymorpha]|uniref:Uncharacterized protein n=1 Tax=Dreissena polymorpha TaxID=45954 RepID=A0A9D4JYT4_DREPO|nr:uncharacterized protein LOC127832695 [Dreissena polymorpha]KAH3828079.1 hypothetical protein DPMN_130029 [Dreissena polymorpha]
MASIFIVLSSLYLAGILAVNVHLPSNEACYGRPISVNVKQRVNVVINSESLFHTKACNATFVTPNGYRLVVAFNMFKITNCNVRFFVTVDGNHNDYDCFIEGVPNDIYSYSNMATVFLTKQKPIEQGYNIEFSITSINEGTGKDIKEMKRSSDAALVPFLVVFFGAPFLFVLFWYIYTFQRKKEHELEKRTRSGQSCA